MSRLLGHKIPLKILFNAVNRDQLHHTILLHGPEGVGKLEACFHLSKSLMCTQHDRLDKKGTFCNHCEACLKVHLFRHPNITVLSNSDRMINIRWCRHLLKQKLTTTPKRIGFYLVHEISHLLYRHKMNFLPRVQREKKTYTEGVKLSDKQLEDMISDSYERLNDYYKKDALDPLLEEAFIESLSALQNSLDRSLFTKEAVQKALSQTNSTSSRKKRLLIIENASQMHHSVIPSLLKILEEPTPNMHFVLTASDLRYVNEALSKPLISRCLLLSFRELHPDMSKRILKETFQVSPDEAIFHETHSTLRDYFENMMKIKRVNSAELQRELHAIIREGGGMSALYETVLAGNISLTVFLSHAADFIREAAQDFSMQDPNEAAKHPHSIHKLWHFIRLIDEMNALKNLKTLPQKSLYLRLFTGMKQIFH